ncbi:TetR/AcrR family transcriptional regulator [Desulfospira joergensenii]|uniref:TetR/AcrR family transcriptional regulator n=1 Tax=Desulfospira joergensenii TaxID=53329 RepID=UPI0003B37F93|nr:TetR/AcrR family transcriptional regulator [Desulfospira joergensenii]
MGESRFAELKEKEKQARKQIVIESALALFAKKPFYEVGMREVADEAGISPATIYRYFPSQEELFNEAFLQDIYSVSKEFQKMVEKEEPASIDEFGIKFVEHLIENESSFQMMAYLMLKYNLTHPVKGKFDSVTKVFFDLFSTLLKRHGMSEENARIYSHSFVASITGILMTFRNFPLKDRESVKAHIIKIVKITASIYSAQLLNRK